jgi:chromosome segregation ATPase
LRRNWEDPENEQPQTAPAVIDLTEAADKVPPEDYPVLVFLRDQLIQAREEMDQLKAALGNQAQKVVTVPDEAELVRLKAHYERLLDAEQGRRSEVQEALESERLLRMEAETTIASLREELKQKRGELKTAAKNERARAVDAKDNLVKAEEELVEIKKILAEADEDLDFLKTQSSPPGDIRG